MGSFSIDLADLAGKTKERYNKKFKKMGEVFKKGLKLNFIFFNLYLFKKVPGFGNAFGSALKTGQGAPIQEFRATNQRESSIKPQFFDLEIGKAVILYIPI